MDLLVDITDMLHQVLNPEHCLTLLLLNVRMSIRALSKKPFLAGLSGGKHKKEMGQIQVISIKVLLWLSAAFILLWLGVVRH